MNNLIRLVAFAILAIWASGAIAQALSIKDEQLRDKVLAYHQNNAECSGRNSKMQNSEFIRFKGQFEDIIVVLVTCEFHAYQVSWVAYAVYGMEEPDIRLLSFPSTNDGKKWTAGKTIMSPEWNRETKILTSYYKGRGIGDCGSYETYRWDEGAFYIASANYKACCWSEDSGCKKNAADEAGGNEEQEWPLVFKYQGD